MQLIDSPRNKNIKKRPIIPGFLILMLISLSGMAQQEPHFSQNMFNNMGINPGYAGLRSAICATAFARQQWVGLRDAEGTRVNPETYSLFVDAPLPIIRGGLSLGFLQDQLGPETNVGVKIGYSYHHRMASGKLGIGLQLGFLDKRIDFGRLEPVTPGDPVLTTGDQSHMFVDFSLGAFYLEPDAFFAGLSFSQLRASRQEFDENAGFKLSRHGYAMAGYHYTLPGNPAYVLSPSLLVKSDLASLQFDLNALVTYNKQFWGGVSYRPQDAVVVMLGVRLESISLGYSYDVTTSMLGGMGRSYGSHEIMLQYCFDLDIDRIRQIQRNVRFL